MNSYKSRFTVFFALMAGIVGLTAAHSAHAIKRCEVLKRAQAWVDDPNSWYSWSATYTDPTTGICCYRPDCSGLVSAAWGLPPPGNTTYSFAGGPWDNKVSYIINAGDLKPGDAVNYPGNPSAQSGHIMLYVSGNFASGYIEVMEEFSTGHTAARHWRSIDTSIYLPIRYNHIEDDGPEICNGIDDNCNGQIDEGNVCELDGVLWGSAMNSPARTTDVDGDGKADVCGRGYGGIWCRLSTGSSWTESPLAVALSDTSGWGNSQYYSTIRYGDIDGNGKADVCARGAVGVGCWMSGDQPLSQAIEGPRWSDANGWGTPRFYTTIRLLDIDGDGKDDMCARASSGVECYKSLGTSFGPSFGGPGWSDDAGLGEPKYYSTLRAADINGDGKEDLCMRVKSGMQCYLSDGNGFATEVKGPAWSDENGWGKPEYYTTIRIADVNGDRKADICARSASALGCHFSNGDSFGSWVQVAPLSNEQGWTDESVYSTLRTGDVDGDGAQELCIRAHAGMSCYRWNGAEFDIIGGPPLESAKGWNKQDTYFTIQMADFNGDGKADICGRHSDGWRCYPSTGTGFGEPVAVAEFSNEGGWVPQKYSATIAIGGPRCATKTELCNGIDDNCNGEIDEGCPEPGSGTGGAAGSGGSVGAGGTVGSDGGVLSDVGGGGRSNGQKGGSARNRNGNSDDASDSESGCGCRVYRSASAPSFAWLTAIGAAAAVVVMRRRRVNRNR